MPDGWFQTGIISQYLKPPPVNTPFFQKTRLVRREG